MLMDDVAYANRLRHAHPAEKAGFAMLCLLASLVARTPIVPVLTALTTSLAALSLARVPPRAWMKLNLLPVGFLLVGGLPLALEFGSACGPWSIRLTESSWVRVSPASLRLTVQVTARSLGCTMAMLFLAATTPLTDLIQLLRKAKVPGIVLEMLTITYRSLFILLETSEQMQRAQASRLGYSGFRASLRSLTLMVTRLFGHSLERSNLAWQAMLSRGYGEVLRVLPPEYHLSKGRALMGAGAGLTLLALACFLPGGW